MKFKRQIAITLVILLSVLITRVIFTKKTANLLTSSSVFTVYFASAEDTYLVPETRVGAGTINNRLEALIEGPRNQHLTRVFPLGTKLISYQIVGDLLYVNFNEAFVKNHPGGSSGELLTVYGLVNSVTEDPAIKQVIILVEGKRIPTLAGHVDLLEPLTRDLSMMVKMQ